MEFNLFVTTGTGEARYWYCGNAVCRFCQQPMKLTGYHVTMWRKDRTHEVVLVCTRCASKIPKEDARFPVHERRNIIMTDCVPPKSRPVLLIFPELVWGGVGLTDAARSNKGICSEVNNVRMQDVTRLAGRPNATFLDDNAPVLIGADVSKLLAEKDLGDGLDLLEDMRGENDGS